MKKSFWGFLAAAAVVVTVAAPMSAQTLHLTATIPFEFTVENSTMPAGEYSVQALSTPKLIQVRNEGMRSSVLTVTESAYSGEVKPAGAPRLVFKRYGSHYVLSQIWDGSKLGRELPTTRTERQMARTTPVERLEILAMLTPR
jgi:hypothetical protein